MAQPAADRNLLFGILALQMDFITRDGLVAAMNAWLLQKHRPLADLLEESGALEPAARALLEPLVRHHIDQHGGDPAQSLASLSSVDWIRADLAPIGETDPEVQHSLARLVPATVSPGDQPEATAACPRPAGSGGTRFRIIRFHARGGLGEVFVADDAELHREVALKQIQDRHGDQPESRARFLLEAEITGGLEHPGIVPVYGLGHHDDGRPFYAMRFIKGNSLREAIERFHGPKATGSDPGERTLELQKLLRRFLDVCNAIAYAHSRGVLHRDIKPGNIMVGQYGETLVVDWGMAKVVGAAEGSGEATLRPPSASGSSETLPGSAIGTPGFMSPEQAAGRLDRLGPASDVYSLGATLYSLLTGKAPIDGPGLDVEEILGRVRRGEFPRPRQVEPDVPRAMEAICLKAMAQEPEDRYGTPGALAEDVERWLADEPVTAWREPLSLRVRRWTRRNRMVVTAATATVLVGVVALGVTYKRESAINARLAKANRQVMATNAKLLDANARVTKSKEESDRRLDQTLQAIEDYYTGVGQEVLLGQSEFQDLRARLIEKPRQFYEQLARELEPSSSPDERMKQLLAKGYQGLGRISLLLGRPREAGAHFESSIRSFRELAGAQPGSPTYRDALASSSSGLGLSQIDAGKTRQAIESFQEAIAIYEKLTAERPELAEYQEHLAKNYANLGNVQKTTGDQPGAERSYRENIAIFTKLSAAKPNVMEYANGLAMGLTNLGSLQSRTGDLRGAEVSNREAIAIFAKLAAAKPDVAEHQNGLAASHNRLGIVQASRGDSVGAVHSFRQAVAIRTKLTERQPNVAKYKNDLAVYHNNLANAQRGADPRAAAESYREAISIFVKLVATFPNVVPYQEELARAYTNYGMLQIALADPHGAAESYREAIAIRTKLVAAEPIVPEYRNGLASSYSYLGDLQRTRGELPLAAESFRQAKTILIDLVAKHPDVPVFQQSLAGCLGNIGLLQRSNGDFRGAAESMGQTIAIFAKMVAKQPSAPAYRESLAKAHSNLGVFQFFTKEFRNAAESYRRSSAIFSELVAADPNSVELRLGLGQAFYNLGLAEHKLERHDEAEQAFREAIVHNRFGFARAPQVVAFRRKLSEGYQDLSATLRLVGRANEAAQITRERRKLWERNPKELYETVCELALCVPIVRGAAEKQALAAEAIEELRAAIAAGWTDAQKTSRDPDLMSLRDRGDFRQLVAELFDRVFPPNPFGP